MSSADGTDKELRAEPEAGEEAPASGEPEELQPAVAPQDDDGSEAAALESDLEELMAKARERDEYLSLAQRTQADFENFRKRAAKDIGAAEARGVAKLARELLPALDNLQLALSSAEPKAGEDAEAPVDGGGRQLVEGIRLVAAELSAALARVGIEPYSPEGERFDPAEHEAMAQQPVEGAEPGTIVEVYQRGYRANGSVLRPARVVVAQ